mmetsp:Transcript_33653/g.39561  ORF Transcript_33653/g.39561 Transcript_33653/m.39561 type:complete len:532 (-) Transcript_33653:140-1735(-)
MFDMRHIKRIEAAYSLLLSGLVIFILAMMSIFLGRDTTSITEVIVSPLTQLARDMDRVSRFDLTDKKKFGRLGQLRAVSKNAKQLIHSVDSGVGDNESSILEVQSIQRSFATMKTTIQSFAKYVPQDVVYQLVRAKAGIAKLDVEEREVTVLFSDIENFTKICESLGVGDKLLGLMSDYFTGMSDIISNTGGCLLEFIEDAVLAVWNAPTPEEMHAVLAVTAALEMHAYLESMAEEWDAKGYPRVRIRCGIHTAKVLVGNIGAPDRMKYGVLGDGVNTASRLEETNKRYGTRTLISEATFRTVNRQINGVANAIKNIAPTPTNASSANGSMMKLSSIGSSTFFGRNMAEKQFFEARPVDRVVFKGKTKPTTLYEVVDFTADHKNDLNPKHSFTPKVSQQSKVKVSSKVHSFMERLKMSSVAASESFSLADTATKVVNAENLKDLLLDTHNNGWMHYLRRDFKHARTLFNLVDEIQKELGPRTQVSGLPNDFGDSSEGDLAAILLRDRCDAFLVNPPPREWDGSDVLKDKHF